MKQAVNHVLIRTTGYQLTKGGPSPASTAASHRRVDRSVSRPAFALSAVRTGSAVLRTILDQHSRICAPHDVHLETLRVRIGQSYGKESMKQLGLDERGLEYLLWDRVLQRELVASGKSVIVDTTPDLVSSWKRLHEAWPSARYLVLLGHPAGERVTDTEQIDTARDALPGLTIRYEDLAKEPERVTAEICSYLEVPWERTMLDGASFDTDRTVPTDDEIPSELRALCERWGYLP